MSLKFVLFGSILSVRMIFYILWNSDFELISSVLSAKKTPEAAKSQPKLFSLRLRLRSDHLFVMSRERFFLRLAGRFPAGASSCMEGYFLRRKACVRRKEIRFEVFMLKSDRSDSLYQRFFAGSPFNRQALARPRGKFTVPWSDSSPSRSRTIRFFMVLSSI